MNKELLEAMEVLEKEKNISKDTLIEAIETLYSLPVRTISEKPIMLRSR